MYGIILKRCIERFHEDNEVTVRHYLIERFQQSFNDNMEFSDIDVEGEVFQQVLSDYEKGLQDDLKSKSCDVKMISLNGKEYRPIE